MWAATNYSKCDTKHSKSEKLQIVPRHALKLLNPKSGLQLEHHVSHTAKFVKTMSHTNGFSDQLCRYYGIPSQVNMRKTQALQAWSLVEEMRESFLQQKQQWVVLIWKLEASDRTHKHRIDCVVPIYFKNTWLDYQAWYYVLYPLHAYIAALWRTILRGYS